MSAQWFSNTSDVAGRVTAAAEGALHGLARPARARRLRQVLAVLFALWAVLAVVRLFWALFPSGDMPVPGADTRIINPISSKGAPSADNPVDIQSMMSWHLFGKAGADLQPTPAAQQLPSDQQAARDGIEDGARETRLSLTLRGVVASTDDGLGHAIIEHKKKQAVYAVDDKLPVSGKVVLAKVMPRQVVLDNGGKYELLTLFDQSSLDGQLPAQAGQKAGRRTPNIKAGKPSAAVKSVDKRQQVETTALAQDYRQRLYKNPQSLAEVVNVSAVRKDGQLLGYRIGPGKNREQFTQLGFQNGDLVTGVNGIALDDPANTMRLYQTMRSASEAVFDLKRGEQQLSVSVSLDGDGS